MNINDNGYSFSLVTVLQSRNVQKSVFPSISKFIIFKKTKILIIKAIVAFILEWVCDKHFFLNSNKARLKFARGF